ncbi:MAG: hypothetical protein WAL95_14625 [Candidatus Acidiferrales bacterium]
MRSVGFSTGALARADFRAALVELATHSIACVELSALRYPELAPLLDAIPTLPLAQYRYVSLHAPSQFQGDEEREAARLIERFVPADWPVIIHPDTILDFKVWQSFGSRVAIENMDRRKPIGRTAEELARVFEELPLASLCFDIGHARQFDTTMTEAYRILQRFRDRICQVHISEVNSASQHDRLSFASIQSFRQVANMIPESIPVIVESRVREREIEVEISKAEESLSDPKVARVSA